MVTNNLTQKNILITFLFKEGAGPVFTFEMAKGLASNGCNVYVVLSNKISNRSSWEKESTFKKVHFIETGTRQTAIQATIRFFLVEQFRIRKQYKSIHFDYVISTFYHPWASTLLNCFNGKKIVICHDPIHHTGVKLMERLMTTLYIKKADDIIVLTKSFIPIVEQRFKFSFHNIHYMPHGRMTEYAKQAESHFSNIEQVTNKNIKFLFFGRIEKYKGLHVLAKAYKQLVTIYNEIELIVAGSGDFNEYVNDFKNLPNTKIINSYIPDEQIQSFFDKPNTILVLPYLDASQSGVIPIALEYGVPIIASNTGGLKEQLNDGKIGFFCSPNDEQSLKEQMQYLIEHPDVIKDEKDKINSYLQQLNWDVITKPLLSI